VVQRAGRQYRRLVAPTVARRAHTILTVSATERTRLAQALGLAEERIVVAPNALPSGLEHHHAGSPLDRPYLLHLGNTDPKKNTLRTVRAWWSARRREPGLPDLVVADLDRAALSSAWAGAPDPGAALHTPGYLPRPAMATWLGHAVALLYPSLDESFGLPLLEGMAMRLPVLTSNAGALPEVAGAAAVFVEPRDERSIEAGIRSICTDGPLRSALIAAGTCRLAQYSWSATACIVRGVYARVNSTEVCNVAA
jgi:glycosyltransferase involved in cell wall biosynthesis